MLGVLPNITAGEFLHCTAVPGLAAIIYIHVIELKQHCYCQHCSCQFNMHVKFKSFLLLFIRKTMPVFIEIEVVQKQHAP